MCLINKFIVYIKINITFLLFLILFIYHVLNSYCFLIILNVFNFLRYYSNLFIIFLCII